MFHVLTLRKKRDKNLRTAEQFPRMKENDFVRVRFDVVPTNPSGRIGREPDVPSDGPEPHLSGCEESIARAQCA